LPADTDAIATLKYLFLGGRESGCRHAADTSDTRNTDLTDAVYLLNFLFLRVPNRGSPFPSCGSNPTVDRLTFESSPPCADVR
jgi:hypothetical protein